jgi:hypothetical protein
MPYALIAVLPVITPPSPPLPPLAPAPDVLVPSLHALIDAVTSDKPSITAPAVRGRVPSEARKAAPQLGQTVSRANA